ncbi:MAG: hypothetical protein R2911_30835 [Caldilineaceae bacterium]
MTTRTLKLISIPLAILIITATAIFAAESRRTPEWQTTLEQYAAQRNLAVIEVVRARQPHNFTGELDYPIVFPGQFEYTADITYEQPNIYQIALPYPAEEAHCALVEHSGRRKLLFVNYYSDRLWRNGWVVHYGPRYATSESMQITGQLSCRFAAIQMYCKESHV